MPTDTNVLLNKTNAHTGLTFHAIPFRVYMETADSIDDCRRFVKGAWSAPPVRAHLMRAPSTLLLARRRCLAVECLYVIRTAMAPREKKQSSSLRVPPQDTEVEMSVLGALMLDKDAIYRVADFLRSGDFYKPEHVAIYDAMVDLYGKKTPIDILSVSARLKEKKGLEPIGGTRYLTSLVNSVPTAGHVAYYAAIVNKKRVLRDLIAASHHIAELGYKEDSDVEDLLDQAEQRIFSISQTSLQQGFISIKDALGQAWDRLEQLHKGGGALRGVPTGFPDLDDLLQGLQKSDLIILAARPSLGKTSLALNIAKNVALDGKKPVAIFSLEMSQDQLIDRLISSESNVDSWRIRSGNLKDEDFTEIRSALQTLSDSPLFIHDVSSPTVMQLRTLARRLHREHDIGLIIIDYLQLIRGNTSVESRVQEVSEISRGLKALAKELNVPVLALSQLSRAVEMRTDAKPKLSDLRESGSIEQDADVVMFIYREDKAKQNAEKKNIAEILVEKHRNGPTGKINLFFDQGTMTFRSVAKNLDTFEAF